MGLKECIYYFWNIVSILLDVFCHEKYNFFEQISDIHKNLCSSLRIKDCLFSSHFQRKKGIKALNDGIKHLFFYERKIRGLILGCSFCSFGGHY